MKDSSQNYFSYDHNFHSLVAQVVLGHSSKSAFIAQHNMENCLTGSGLNVS